MQILIFLGRIPIFRYECANRTEEPHGCYIVSRINSNFGNRHDESYLALKNNAELIRL